MSQQSNNILFIILRAIVLFLLKVLAITLAWACKLAGLILTVIGEKLEKVIVK